jgi:tetraacyldisaccharide 4'-kinase
MKFLLWPLSVLYGFAVRVRALLYANRWIKQKRLNGAVVSVGNLTVGGTGKTPMVIWLAEKFLSEGRRVAILSRGYRGEKGSSDEIEIMKARLGDRVVFGVGKNRFAEGQKLAANRGIDLFLLDDGFQHLALARDVDIVLLDATRQLGEEWLLPSGRMREPLSALSRADIAVFTRVENAPEARAALGRLTEFPVFAASTKLLGFRRLGGDGAVWKKEEIGGGPFYAFCGIGNPQAFFRDLSGWGLSIAGEMQFRDHHRYAAADVRTLEAAAEFAGAKAFVTTEKDAQNLSGVVLKKLPVFVSAISLDITPENDFLGAIERILQKRQEAA